jgi:hypothetical protein
MSTPARSITRRRSRLTPEPGSSHISVRSSASPTRGCSASCRPIARLTLSERLNDRGFETLLVHGQLGAGEGDALPAAILA